MGILPNFIGYFYYPVLNELIHFRLIRLLSPKNTTSVDWIGSHSKQGSEFSEDNQPVSDGKKNKVDSIFAARFFQQASPVLFYRAVTEK
jgi:hypothetical protein